MGSMGPGRRGQRGPARGGCAAGPLRGCRRRRTDLGSLTHLIRGAAIRAILDGQEQITRPLLDSVRIDHAAESATRRASSTR